MLFWLGVLAITAAVIGGGTLLGLMLKKAWSESPPISKWLTTGFVAVCTVFIGIAVGAMV